MPDGDLPEWVAQLPLDNRGCYKILRELLIDRYQRRVPPPKEQDRELMRVLFSFRQGGQSLAHYVSRGNEIKFKCRNTHQIDLLIDAFIEGLNNRGAAGTLNMADLNH